MTHAYTKNEYPLTKHIGPLTALFLCHPIFRFCCNDRRTASRQRRWSDIQADWHWRRPRRQH